MVEITGELIDSQTVDGATLFEWRIPSFTEEGARRRAKGNSRIKGASSPKIVDIAVLEEGQLPAQQIYTVTVEGER